MMSNSIPNTPSKTSIKEANEHIHRMMARVAELEATVSKQADAMATRDQQLRAKHKEMEVLKDNECALLKVKIESLEDTTVRLHSTLAEMERQLNYYKSRCWMLESAVQACAPLAKSIAEKLTVTESYCSQPQAVVPTVSPVQPNHIRSPSLPARTASNTSDSSRGSYQENILNGGDHHHNTKKSTHKRHHKKTVTIRDDNHKNDVEVCDKETCL